MGETKALLACAAIAALSIASGCGSGHDLVVDIEPGCTAATATLVRIDVTLTPSGSQRVELQAASFFAPESTHTVVVIPHDGTTGIDVDVTVFDAASKLVGSGHSHTDISGAGEDHATITFGDCHGTDGGVVPTDGNVVHDAGPGDMACPSGYTRCGADCVDLTSDVLHCGSCSNACDLSHFCQASMCVANCTGNTTLCGMSCVDTNTSNANCGGCGMACGPTVAHGTASCQSAFCSIAMCDSGWDDCNFDISDGCEQAVSNDPKNCGSCGNDCSMVPNVASTSCGGTTCVIGACQPGWSDCDKKWNTGCESNPMTDAMNCGGCGTVCPTGGGCVGGKCVTPATFSALTSPTTVDLQAAWGTGANSVYLVGGAQSVLHSTDGTTFTVVRTAQSATWHLNSIWGSSATDIWANGDAGLVLHFDGNSWTQINVNSATTFDGVWTDGPSNVFLVGYNTVLKGGLSGFTPQATGISNEWVFGVWGVPGGAVHVVADGSNVANFVAGSWSLVNDGGFNMYAIWGASPTQIWLVGQQGAISSSTDGGKTFMREQSPVTTDLKGVWGSGPNDIYAVGLGGVLLHSWGDGTWTKLQSGTSAALAGVWGTGPKNVYVVGQAGTILHGM